jgi:hypothetical protein
MKFFKIRPSQTRLKFLFKETADGIENVRLLGVETSKENILKALETLLEIYVAYCEARHKISDQGIDLERVEVFFEGGRTVQVGSFQATVNSIKELEQMIQNFKVSLGKIKRPDLAPEDEV